EPSDSIRLGASREHFPDVHSRPLSTQRWKALKANSQRANLRREGSTKHAVLRPALSRPNHELGDCGYDIALRAVQALQRLIKGEIDHGVPATRRGVGPQEPFSDTIQSMQ